MGQGETQTPGRDRIAVAPIFVEHVGRAIAVEAESASDPYRLRPARKRRFFLFIS